MQEDFQSLKKISHKIKKVFFFRVCGTGMGAAACLLAEKGLAVTGADSNYYPPMSTYLKSTGIPLLNLSDVNEELLKTFDLIVVGNVVANGCDDAKLIERSGVRYASFPATIGALVLDDVNVVGIAGTHGKTTTTYLATQVFEKLGANPGYLIGGVMEGRNSAKLGSGKYFFIESDEYDSAYFEKISKFRSYSLKNLILTSLEFDHADIFNSISDIKKEFSAALPHIHKTLIFSSDYPAIRELQVENHLPENKIIWYGEKEKNGPVIIESSPNGTSFKLNEKVYSTNLVGKHNILNLASVILYALSEGFKFEELCKAISDLQMVKRRQEVRGMYRGAVVIDDFAHHPRAVELTIDGIKTIYPSKKLHVIMEPNSATARSNIFQEEFTRSLNQADSVIFTKPTRPTSVKNAKDLDIEKIVNIVKESGRYGKVVGKLDELMVELNQLSNQQSVVLILSNGTCLGLWDSNFLKELVVPVKSDH